MVGEHPLGEPAIRLALNFNMQEEPCFLSVCEPDGEEAYRQSAFRLPHPGQSAEIPYQGNFLSVSDGWFISADMY